MNFFYKMLTALIIAVLASLLTSILHGSPLVDPIQLAVFFIATAATALLVSPHNGSLGTAAAQENAAKPVSRPAAGGKRESGKVKWFNASKGFGFIIRENGEEIFVHFRSIRGEGRRSLRDGQQVTFTVADSDKGPQAEDVEAQS